MLPATPSVPEQLTRLRALYVPKQLTTSLVHNNSTLNRSCHRYYCMVVGSFIAVDVTNRSSNRTAVLFLHVP